jgi:hypothetical protein
MAPRHQLHLAALHACAPSARILSRLLWLMVQRQDHPPHMPAAAHRQVAHLPSTRALGQQSSWRAQMNQRPRMRFLVLQYPHAQLYLHNRLQLVSLVTLPTLTLPGITTKQQTPVFVLLALSCSRNRSVTHNGLCQHPERTRSLRGHLVAPACNMGACRWHSRVMHPFQNQHLLQHPNNLELLLHSDHRTPSLLL